MHLSAILPATLLGATALAAPLAPRGPTKTTAPDAESIILATAPKSASCDPAADFAAECRTAAEAAPYLIKAFSDHKVYAPAEISALLSLIAFETGDLKYNRNHFPAPGRPGQGTRNLQMINFNLAYALDVPELRAEAESITAGVGADSLTDDQKNKVLELVLPDKYSWASAAWFLTTQCDASVRAALQSGSREGLDKYLSECVGTEVTDDRVAYWQRAKDAFGI
ncbi:hypothetical protein VD0004_g3978 [Verticillium dahliae]|nr:hypothetical protein VD0004_g3978 [Verticillium dahliae]PNH74753.1 hypothetical protein VD0001_g2791 [Verticillium dahliae]